MKKEVYRFELGPGNVSEITFDPATGDRVFGGSFHVVKYFELPASVFQEYAEWMQKIVQYIADSTGENIDFPLRLTESSDFRIHAKPRWTPGAAWRRLRAWLRNYL